jgi:hypothetical protein
VIRTPVPDAALALAEAQHGVLARHQLLRSCASATADDLLRGGGFERLVRGVYRVRGGARLPEQVAFASALRARPAATITGPLALGLLGVPGLTGASPFELLLQPNRWLSNLDVARRVDPFPDRPVTLYGDVRLVAPVDALIDSAGFLDAVGERTLRVAWDHLRGNGLVTVDRLLRRCEQLRGEFDTVATLEALLAVGGGAEVESEGERSLHPFLDCFEPGFEAQVWITPNRRLDFFSRRCRYGYEYVGKVDHAHVAARLRDDERDAELRTEGVRIGYVTAADLAEPRTFMATVAGTLTVRAHELGVEPPVAVRPLRG